MQFVPLSKIEDQDAGLQFVPLQFVPLASEPTKAPAASASVAPSAPVAPAAPAAVETAAGVLPEEAPTGMFAPRRDATFLGELGRGAKGAVEYGFPSMGRQLALQGSASAMVERQNQMALMDQIDQGQFKTLAELKNNPQYQALRKEGGDAGMVNAYFANRSQPEINAKLRGKVEGEMTKLAGDTAGHIKTLNQYARENKAKYGARVEKFTDINWADPAVAADFKDWLGYNMGAGAVQMAPIMLAAVIGKQPGLLATSAGMGVSEAVGTRLKFIQDKVKSLPPDQQGEAIAKYIAESGDTNLITGLVSGSFDLLLGPAAKAAKANLPMVIGKGVAAKQALKELPKDIGSEFVTGGLQQMTQIAAAKKLQEEGRSITWENIQDVINSAAAEAAGAPAGTAVNVGRAAVAAPSSAADALAAAIEADAKRAGATTAGLRRGETLEQAGEEVERPFVFTPAAAPVVPPEAVAPVAPITAAPITAAPAGEQLEVIPGMPTGEEVEAEAPAAVPPDVTPVTPEQPVVAPTPAAAALPETPAAPPAAAPKAFEPPAPQHAVGTLPVQEVPVSDLRLSKDVPQFKIGASEKGVVEPLGGKFERTGVAPIQVWRRLDGSMEVISGRHRLDLAQRSGEKTIPAQVHQEADGFTADDAAILDAELNIRDGQGKVKDYVNYFKGSGISRQEADARGLLARATGKRSYTIAANGSEELIAAVRADQVGDEAAFYIALNAPNDARLQNVGIKAIMDGKSMSTAVNMMQAVKALAGENDTTTDMFGFDDSAMREAEEMAKLAAQKQREVQTRLSAITGAARNPAVAKAEGIDIKDPEAVKRRIDELRQMKSAWDNWSTNPELVAEIRAARGVAAPTLTLEAQTAEDLRQKAEQKAAAAKREAEEKRKAEEKAKADQEREEFTLTGSDREADEAAARGQTDIFGAPAEEKPSAKEVVNKYLRKVRATKPTESFEDYEGQNIRTVTYEWQGAINRSDFDALTSEAQATQLKRGNKYTISLEETPTTSSTLAFTARGLTPTQQRVEVVMQLQTSTVMEQPAAQPGEAVDENDPGFRGASDEEVAEVASAFEGAKDNQEDEANTRVFDAPAKSEIVRIEQKAARSGVLTIAQAKERIAEWKRNAKSQGKTSVNSDKIVLSLFDATGEWSKPWEEAGYQVFRFDIQTDPEMGDVNKFSVEFFNDLYGAFDGQDVYAILAACPCTDFAVSGARHFAAKDASGKTVESVELVYQTLRTVEFFKPSIWAIENPVGRIEKLTGLPPWRMSFNPNHFGDPYTKKTLLWGRFNADLPVAPVAPTEGSKMHRMYGGKSQDTKNARSVTPEGFAYAFFQSNNAVDNPVMAVANKYDMLKPAVIKQALDAGLTSQEISNVVDDPYYMDLDYEQAEADLKAAIKEKTPTKGVGAAVMGERMVNAADRFRKAAMNQFKLTQEQADAAMGKLLKEKILILDPVTGQFELKDGRFWNREVMMRAAEAQKDITLESIEPAAAGKSGRAGWTEKRVDGLISTYGYADGKTFGIAAFVDPQFFLEATTASVAGIRQIRTEAGELDLQKLASETQTPYLKINIGADGAWEIVGHEGRHRAAALQKEGIGQMPVVLNILKGGFKYPAKFEVAASQELLGQTFGKARGEDIEVFNLIPINQQNKELLNREFGSGQILYSIEPTKKLPPGRSPELAAAAKQLQEGQMTSSEFDELVNRYKPIPVYFAPLKPATSEQVYNALDSAKREKIDPDIPKDYPVGLRLDIPAFNRHGVFVVSIHEKRTASSPGKVIGYSSVASIKNVTFGVGNQKEALKIAAGSAKDAIQTMEGKYNPITPEQAYQTADDAILSGDWVQVGFDPTRHAYFFDRSTTMPVVAADEVIQIGNMILAKGVTYGKKEDFLYSIDATGTPVPAAQAEAVEKTRKEQIREYAKLRAEIAKVPDKIIKGEASLDMQATLSRMMQEARDLQYSIRMSKPRRDTAEEFLARALKEYADGNISRDVLDAIQAAYSKEPALLEGLMLSVRKKAADDGAAAGTFSTFQRLVTLFKGTSGVQNPEVVRHELTHSLEQMMLPEQRMAVVQAWGKALQRAIKQNPDDLHQKYFNAILDFLQDPTEQKLRLAQAAMPSMDMYQYINPSEFWAVNAEKLMAAQLGSSWEKFKRAVRKLWEGLKKVFGFDNRYEIHKVFNQVMGGSKERMTYGSLVSMINNTGGDFVTLKSIEEEKDLLEKYSRPKTPQLDTTPILTFLTRQFKNGKEFFQSATENPREAMVGAGNSVVDGLIYLRNKNVWYGSGLEARDFDRYNGDLKTSEGMATASAALDNAIRSGNIGVEVIFRGGIKFDPRSNSFVAVETERGMRGVYEAEAALKKRLGKQLGTDIIQGYLEAKRSISIMNELYEREAVFETTKEQLRYLRESGADPDDIALAKEDLERATQELEAIKKAASSVNMSQEEMDEFAALDAKHPELRDIMDNWTAVNQNLLRFWRQVGLLSQGRYETLSAIKDYVPWYRIMNDEEDVHSPIQSTTRSMTNIGREKLFKRGKPISVVDVRAKEGQKDFKIQPSSVVTVEVNGKKVNPDLVTATPEGNVRIDMDLKANDLVVFKTNREIENIIDNMTRNVMRMTMNGIRQYAANRIVLEYASRNEKNKIMVFPAVDKERGRFNWMVNGKKVVVEIQDPLVAASIYGMENLNLQMWKPMAMIANLTRRSITLSGVFQIKQVFKDAPTAALVTGVKNPLALIGGVWKGFVTSLTNTDPVVDILKAAGIGGYMSPARTPEADIKRRLGIMNRNVFSMMIKGLDHIGDASDMAQRVATYKRVLAETGNEAQALYQAANVINFLHHGSAGYAQAAVKVVPFLGAYANATDVLMRALVGGGLKGMSRKKALLRLGVTTSILASLTLLYAMLAGGDPDYDELDDQTKLKNIIIPGTKIMLPMNTSAAYFFKAIPELIYNVVTREGTENEMDRRRIRNALADAARDMLLGPEPIPAGFKPLFEVAINHDFFTGRPVIPEGLKDVEAAEQYVASTSELGKKISAILAIPGTDGKRVLSPIEADHIVRGVFGTSGAMAQWVSNSIGAMAEARPEPTAKEAPITGSFLREEVPRGREDLFYDFKEAVTKKHQTWQKMMDREDYDAAEKYLEKHGDVVSMYEYVNEAEADLKEINAEIRRLGETRSKDETPKERRKDIEDFKRLKQEILDPVKELRRETFTK